MKKLPLKNQTLKLIAIIIPFFALFIYVILRSGPWAPITVTTTEVKSQAITPSIFGIGTVEARYTYKIGPTFAGRIKYLNVNVGDKVQAGQILGAMDPVDLDERVRSQEAALKRATAAINEAKARATYAKIQAQRYEKLFTSHVISEEVVTTKRQELKINDAILVAAKADLARTYSDLKASIAQKDNLTMLAPVTGIVVARNADPGTTIIAGQAVVEVIDPKGLWVNVRFDQVSSSGLAPSLSAHIVLRSRSKQILPGQVLHIEPKADAVTEETLAKVIFTNQPEPLPPIGELAEVTVDLPALLPAPVIPNVALHHEGEKLGVWQIVDGDIMFTPITIGASDLNGNVQVLAGLKDGDKIVTYSKKALHPHSRIHIVKNIVAA